MGFPSILKPPTKFCLTAVLLTLLLCTACSGSIPENAFQGESAKGDDALSWWRVFAMDRVLDYRIWRGSRAGYVALVARNGRLAYARTTGWADIEATVPMTLNTRFQIASMNKPVTAVAAMILVEEGQISLNDPVAMYLPDFADMQVVTKRNEDATWSSTSLDEPIRIRHLLTFTSGIGGYGETDDPLDSAWRSPDIEAAGLGSLADRIDLIPKLTLYEQPGIRWRYGWSLDVLARVVEIAASEPYDVFLQRRIFDPLEMSATGFRDSIPAHVPMAKMYTHTEQGNLVRDTQFDQHYGRGWTPGGGGLMSTAPDYLRFALMLWNGGTWNDVKILKPETVAAMTQLHVKSGVLSDMDIEGLGWGLGMCVVADSSLTPMPASNGDFWWSGRFGTQFWVSPSKDTVVVVMQQTERNDYSGLPIAPAIVQTLAMP